MTTGKFILIVAIVSLASCATNRKSNAAKAFVSVKDGKFMRYGKLYCFMGANYWKGMNLGMPGNNKSRDRLKRELDQMKSAGIRNLRILALTEGPDNTPYRILPAVQNRPTELDENLLKGLDFLLVEMNRRNMTAVVVLNNFWPWSGGMAQYMEWNGAGSIPYPPPHPGGSWDAYQKYTAQFYSNTKAIEQCNNSISQVVNRKNTINNKNYANDPAIMAWELCNEPRGMNNEAAMNEWLDASAAFIKSLDRNHLVTTGSEGYTSAPEYSGTHFMSMHDGPNIDYTTAHIWIQNWGWYDPAKHDETYAGAKAKMLDYLERHVRESKQLGKPFVLEEFGIMKDGGDFDPAASNINRDIYFSTVFQAVLDDMKIGLASGVNFWAWGGEGRPKKPGTMWAKGDEFTGDPPHEPQGWYSVYDTDKSTQAVIKDYSNRIRSLIK